METSAQTKENTETNYEMVAALFIELRQKGLSLSSFDLDILSLWKKNKINSYFLCQVLTDLSDECKEKQKLFPVSLMTIHKRVERILLKSKTP